MGVGVNGLLCITSHTHVNRMSGFARMFCDLPDLQVRQLHLAYFRGSLNPYLVVKCHMGRLSLGGERACQMTVISAGGRAGGWGHKMGWPWPAVWVGGG